MNSQELKEKTKELRDVYEKQIAEIRESLVARLRELQAIADEKGIHEFYIGKVHPEVDETHIVPTIECYNRYMDDFVEVCLDSRFNGISKFELRDVCITFTNVGIDEDDEYGEEVSFECALSHRDNWKNAYHIIEAIEEGLGLSPESHAAAECTHEDSLQNIINETIIDELKYKLDKQNLTATVIELTARNQKNIIIPEEIIYEKETYRVTNIADRTFERCSKLTSVTIPNSVTNIGEEVFNGCSSLTSIIIPEGVTIIKEDVFAGCSSLTSIIIPESVTIIKEEAFWECTSLTSITIPQGVTSIGDSAFGKCSSLDSITIPNSVTHIGEFAFYGCTSLTSIIIPDSVTNIGEAAFRECASLTSIIIPEGVTCINMGTFFKCYSLESISIPNGVTTIEDYAICYCAINTVTIPNSLSHIGDKAFAFCGFLNEIHYNGTIEQWNKIEFGEDWYDTTELYVIHCTDGDIEVED